MINERLLELVKKAGVSTTDHGRGPFIDDDVSLGDLERFAELIVRETLDQVTEFSSLTKAYQAQGIDPEIDVTKEVLKNFGFTRFPRS